MKKVLVLMFLYQINHKLACLLTVFMLWLKDGIDAVCAFVVDCVLIYKRFVLFNIVERISLIL